MTKIRPTDAHSHAGDGKEALVRTRKETDRPTRTHFLEMVEGGTCKDTGKIRSTDANSHPGDGRGWHLSGHEKKQTNNEHSLPGDGRGGHLSEHGKNPTNRRALTSWRRQRKALVRTWQKSDRPTRTHFLELAEGGICQDTERIRQTDAHSHPGDSRGRHLSGHRKQIDQLMRTHCLETVEGGTCKDTERNTPTEAHSLPGDGRGRHFSGHEKQRTDRSALTFWGWHGGTCKDTKR